MAGIRVGGSAVDVADKEVTSLSELSEGDVRRGYIVSAGSVGVLVRSVTPPVVHLFIQTLRLFSVLYFRYKILLPVTFRSFPII